PNGCQALDSHTRSGGTVFRPSNEGSGSQDTRRANEHRHREGKRVKADGPRRAALRDALGLAMAVMLTAVGCLSFGQERAASPPPAQVGLLGHAGQWLTDSTGRVVILHGVNMVAKRPPYVPAAVGFDADDAQFLAQHGFRAVRLGVIWKAI